MPPGRRRRKDRRPAAVPPADGVDRIGDLPDALLHYVLSFLPAEEAVRTCVIARRWRHLWKSATGLRIGCGDENQPPTVTQVQEFVDHLLLLRGDSLLDTCEIRLFESDERDMPRVNLWIRQVILCKVRVLRIRVGWDVEESFPWHDLEGLRPVWHLTRLELTSLRFFDDFLDFSSCPALEDLELDGCDFMYADRISSQSLKRLSITSSCTFGEENRIRICAPNLVSLRLEVGSHRTPVIESMPSLVKAVVEIIYSELDSCSNSDSGDCDDEDCDNCYGTIEDPNCVLLQGLSEAKHLVLISHIKMFIFRRDLKWCPIFRNLKTLLLNEYWCVPTDFSALTYVLEHSPVLEKLTLQLFCKGPKAKVEMNGSPDPTKRSASISEHLNIVEVKCEVVDERVLNVLKFLSKLNIHWFRFQF